MRGHEHEWSYLSPEKRICDPCDTVEILTPAGDWVPVWWWEERREAVT